MTAETNVALPRHNGSVRVLRALVSRGVGEIVRGLAGRESLAPYDAMFFVFGADTLAAFTTVGMLFAIDIVFIDASFRIVEAFEDVRPGRLVVQPLSPYRYVLEVPAGTIARNGVVIGGRIAL